jgi:hypothetical protein
LRFCFGGSGTALFENSRGSQKIGLFLFSPPSIPLNELKKRLRRFGISEEKLFCRSQDAAIG